MKWKSEITYDYRVRLYEDGKYHWKYDLHLLKNPAVLMDVYWVLGVTMIIFACIMFLIQACEEGLRFEKMDFVFKVTGLMTAIMFVLGLLGYLLYSAILGWTYPVIFTMDENGVVHQQAPRAQKAGKRIGALTALVGIFARRPGVMGAGMMAASNTAMSSDFAEVKKVKAIRWMDTIKVYEPFAKNRVFVHKDDFDFVYHYISSRCPKAKIK